MTSVLRRAGADAGQARLGAARQSGGVVKRRWGRIGVGVAAAVIGGWVFGALYLSADDRGEVVVAANDVGRFEVLERSDLRVVRVSSDAAVEWVPAGSLDELVGRTMGVGVAAGSPLMDAQLLPVGERLVGESEAVVGVVVGAADGPHGELAPGTAVTVVTRAAAGGAGGVVEVPGWVLGVSAASSSGDRPVEVVVPRDQAAPVAVAASEARVSLVVVGSG